MRAVIDADACVGCGLCVNICSTVYAMEDDKAIAIVDSIAAADAESAKEAASSCPVEAIKIEA